MSFHYWLQPPKVMGNCVTLAKIELKHFFNTSTYRILKSGFLLPKLGQKSEFFLARYLLIFTNFLMLFDRVYVAWNESISFADIWGFVETSFLTISSNHLMRETGQNISEDTYSLI